MEQAPSSSNLVSKRRGTPRCYAALLAASLLWGAFLALLFVRLVMKVPSPTLVLPAELPGGARPVPKEVNHQPCGGAQGDKSEEQVSRGMSYVMCGFGSPCGPPSKWPHPELPRLVPPDMQDAALVSRASPSLQGMYFVCIDRAGTVCSVRAIGGNNVPAADDFILAALRTWRFRPQPGPLCALRTIRFEAR